MSRNLHAAVAVQVFLAPRAVRHDVTPLEDAVQLHLAQLHLAERLAAFEVRRENGHYFAGQSFGDRGFLVLAHADTQLEAATKALEVYEG